jgi:hypothetical protein
MRRQPRYTRTSPAAEGRDRDWTYTAPRPDTIGEIEQKNSSRDLTQGRALPRDLSEHRVEEPGRARSGGRHQKKKSAAAKTKLAQNENQECQNPRQQKNPQAARASVTKIENQILTCHTDTRTE